MSSTWFTTVSLLLAVVNATAAVLVLLLRSGGSKPVQPPAAITTGRAVAAAGAAGALCILQAILLGRAGWTSFGLTNLIYCTLVVGLPLACIVVLCVGILRKAGKPFRRLARPVRLAAMIGLLAMAVGVYATFIEPFRLVVERASVPLSADREGTRVVRIGALSDIQTAHVTEYERSVCRRLMAERPDVIFIAGDLFQGSAKEFERELPAMRDLHAGLRAPGGVFCVLGNVDPQGWVYRVVQGTGVRLLVNEIAEVDVGDRRLRIAGISSGFLSPPELGTVREIESTGRRGDIRILLAHRPEAIRGLSPDSPIDLVVAGHTHGGQVQLPFFGPLMNVSSVPRSVAAGGLHTLNDRPIYVSRGVGWERGQAPRLRFLCPPEIAILTLEPPRPTERRAASGQPVR
jgi:uncharacterized protein